MSDIEFTNVWDNAAVTQRCVIVHGSSRSVGSDVGSVIVWFNSVRFPAQRFPLSDGFFRAFVPLEEGENKLTFETDVPNQSRQRKELTLRYLPVASDPPVHFCLLVAKDSPMTFDSMPYKIEREGNGLGTAVKKMRMAAYMMSAYTQEQMNRNHFGMRSFQPYAEEEEDTISNRDNSRRRTAHIHIVRMDKTTAEIRDPDVAQQNGSGSNTGALFGWAYDALRAYGGPFNDDFVQAACIYLDGHWDREHNLIVGHAALGGTFNNIKLAIFGGHTLWSWPTCIEDLPAACLDETRSDEQYVGNDANESGSAWEALCVGMGAFQHEVGHLLGCPHEPDGIMLRGYLFWTRSFVALEGFSSRENKVVCRTPRPGDEAFWHRLDIMRFVYHPSFALPGEGNWGVVSKPIVYPTSTGIAIQCNPGVYMLDFHVDDNSRGHREYNLEPNLEISLDEIRGAVPEEFRDKPIDVHVHSAPTGQIDVGNVQEFVAGGGSGSTRFSVATGQTNGDEKSCHLPADKEPSLVRIYSGLALDGVEFVYPDGETVLFGTHGGSPKDWPIQPGDHFVGLCVRSGAWIDAAGVITEQQRSPLWGGEGGGHVDLVPPRGHRFLGVKGWYGQWCNGIAIEYSA